MNEVEDIYEALHYAEGAAKLAIQHRDAAEHQRDKLRAFAQAIMQSWPVGGVDGGEVQDLAIQHGLLVRSKPTLDEMREEGLSEDDDWFRPTALLTGEVF